MAVDLSSILAGLEQQAKAMPAELDGALTEGASLVQFFDDASARATTVSHELEQQSEVLGQRFKGLDEAVKGASERLHARLEAATTQLGKVGDMCRQETERLDQHRAADEKATQALLSRLADMRRHVVDAVNQQRAAMQTGLEAVRSAHERMRAAHGNLEKDLQSVQQVARTSHQWLSEDVGKVRAGLQQAVNGVTVHSNEFATQATAASKALDAGLQRMHDEKLHPVITQRAAKYTGSVQTLQAGTTGALDQVRGGLEAHDAKVSTASQQLDSVYRDHKRHLLSLVPSTDQDLQNQQQRVEQAAEKALHAHDGPLEAIGHFFQSTWQGVAHGFEVIGGALHAAWDGVVRFVGSHETEILVGVAVVTVAAVAIVATAGLAAPAVAAGGAAAAGTASGAAAGGATLTAAAVGGGTAATAGASSFAAGFTAATGTVLGAAATPAELAAVGAAVAPGVAAAAPAGIASVGGFVVDVTVGGVSLGGATALIGGLSRNLPDLTSLNPIAGTTPNSGTPASQKLADRPSGGFISSIAKQNLEAHEGDEAAPEVAPDLDNMVAAISGPGGGGNNFNGLVLCPICSRLVSPFGRHICVNGQISELRGGHPVTPTQAPSGTHGTPASEGTSGSGSQHGGGGQGQQGRPQMAQDGYADGERRARQAAQEEARRAAQAAEQAAQREAAQLAEAAAASSGRLAAAKIFAKELITRMGKGIFEKFISSGAKHIIPGVGTLMFVNDAMNAGKGYMMLYDAVTGHAERIDYED